MEHFTGIDHPAVAARDVEALADWYCEVLGYEKVFRNDQPVWILRAPDDSLLEVMPADDTPRPHRTTQTAGWSHLALRVSDFDAAVRVLEEEQVNWTGETVEAIGGGRLRSFEDPEGNMLQVVERPPDLLDDEASL